MTWGDAFEGFGHAAEASRRTRKGLAARAVVVPLDQRIGMRLPSTGMRAVAAGLTDVGRERKHNEDRFILLPEFGVFVVADGMGGHQSGEVASRMAASSVAGYFRAGERAGSMRAASTWVTVSSRLQQSVHPGPQVSAPG